MVRFDAPLPSWVDRANKYSSGDRQLAQQTPWQQMPGQTGQKMRQQTMGQQQTVGQQPMVRQKMPRTAGLFLPESGNPSSEWYL